MSNEQQNAAVSPEAYISTEFGNACQEIGANPQEVFSMLLFSFMKITPEERGDRFLSLKKDFNTFAAAVDFKSLQIVIDEKIKAAELGLYDSLAKFWETAEIIPFPTK